MARSKREWWGHKQQKRESDKNSLLRPLFDMNRRWGQLPLVYWSPVPLACTSRGVWEVWCRAELSDPFNEELRGQSLQHCSLLSTTAPQFTPAGAKRMNKCACRTGRRREERERVWKSKGKNMCNKIWMTIKTRMEKETGTQCKEITEFKRKGKKKRK